MIERVIATVENAGQVGRGVLGHGDPDPGEEVCDRCGAEGQVYLEHPGSLLTLVMCAHHYGVHWKELVAGGWEVTRDLRARLTIERG